jgi:N-acetylneuraminic acid mutarotase
MHSNSNSACNNRVASMQSLPDEVVMQILASLPLRELHRCSGVNRRLLRLTGDHSVMEGIFLTDGQSTQPKEDVPEPRLWCASAVVGDSLYLYGGHQVESETNLIEFVKGDLFQYHLVTKQWTKLEHDMGKKTELKCVVYDNALWFVGGYNGDMYTNEIRKYDLGTKTSTLVSTSGNPFSPRSALTAVVWKDCMVTFGGWSGVETQWYNDTHKFDFRTKEWQLVQPTTPAPPARTSHVAVCHKNSMYIFGGYDGEKYLNDLWELNLETNVWTNLTNVIAGTCPEPRSRCCAAVYGNVMYLLGGWNKQAYYSDLFTLDLDSNRWTQVSNPNYEIPALSQYSMGLAHDVQHERSFLVMYGGYDGRVKDCTNQLHRYVLPIGDAPAACCTHGRAVQYCLRCSLHGPAPDDTTSTTKHMSSLAAPARDADAMETSVA